MLKNDKVMDVFLLYDSKEERDKCKNLFVLLGKYKCTICDLREGKSALRTMLKEADSFLLTFNLSGFNQTTLTDNISYNLLPCKQIHILTKYNLPNEKYLGKQLSISMFFYCTDSQYYRYLLEKYPNIPYLKEVKGWKKFADEESVETNANILSEIIGEVMQICHMA